MENQQNDEIIEQTKNSNENEIIEQQVDNSLKNKKSKKLLFGVVGGIVVLICAIAIVLIIKAPFSIYARANRNLSNGNFVQAVQLYQSILDYKDSITKCNEAYVGIIENFIENDQYEEALAILEGVEIDNKETYSYYLQGLKCFAEKDYASAIDNWNDAGDFKDAKTNLNEAYYLYAEQKMNEEEYESAKWLYSKTEGKEDVDEKIKNCELMIAEDAYKDGDLPKAQELFSALPKKLTYNGISVDKRLKLLKKNDKLVKLCGSWKGTNGTCSVRQIYKSTGSWDEWTCDYTDYLTIKCILNDDGTFTIKGKAKFYVYTNYSSLSYLLDTDEKTVSFSKTGKTIPETLYSNSNTTLKYNGSSFVLNHDYTNPNYSINFTYRFKSSVTYKK